MPRPNLLLFMPDELRADACGSFGNQIVHTPNLDVLAGNADVAATERALRDQLLEWLLATSDVVPWDQDPRLEPEVARQLLPAEWLAALDRED
jgi:hypothetical protein